VGARCWAAADPYFKEKLARALLPHAVRLAGSSHARYFTRGLALSLLQRKPDEWRRQHATPSSGGAAAVSPKNTRSGVTDPPAIATATNDECDGSDGEQAGRSFPAPARERKKRKRSTAADEIDTLFDDTIGRKVVRSALELPVAPASVPPKSKQGRGQGGERVDGHADLGAVADAIETAPRRDGEKRRKRRPGP